MKWPQWHSEAQEGEYMRTLNYQHNDLNKGDQNLQFQQVVDGNEDAP
jgi:hypothetical protein